MERARYLLDAYCALLRTRVEVAALSGEHEVLPSPAGTAGREAEELSPAKSFSEQLREAAARATLALSMLPLKKAAEREWRRQWADYLAETAEGSMMEEPGIPPPMEPDMHTFSRLTDDEQEASDGAFPLSQEETSSQDAAQDETPDEDAAQDEMPGDAALSLGSRKRPRDVCGRLRELDEWTAANCPSLSELGQSDGRRRPAGSASFQPAWGRPGRLGDLPEVPPALLERLSRCALVYRNPRRPVPPFVCLDGVGAPGRVARFDLLEYETVSNLVCYGMERREGPAASDVDRIEEQVGGTPASWICGYAVFFGGCSGEVRDFVDAMRRTVVSRGAQRSNLFHVFKGPGGEAVGEDRVVVSSDWTSLGGLRGRGPLDLYDNVVAACSRAGRFRGINSHAALVDAFVAAYGAYRARHESGGGRVKPRAKGRIGDCPSLSELGQSGGRRRPSSASFQPASQ
jgi:hypothetical protein